ncbi:hypothetical protein [Streptomyces sp. G45]|uniref:hypothetical protein n=1 Tax=Streptomyces sp. G45 TaxID=3406627 RepID=UPI003C1383C9
MSVTLSEQDKLTLKTAAHGAIALLAASDGTGSPHKIAAQGTIALGSGTGAVGHVLAERYKAEDMNVKSLAEIADKVLPALTESMALLKKQDPAEAENFRGIVTIAVESGTQARKGEPTPPMADVTRKIMGALDAA